MMDTAADLHAVLAWALAALLVVLLTLYVILDGFDLGVGVISSLERDEERRGTMMSALGPVWDGNETWLVVLGGTLFGAFPLVYGVALNALYVPVILMLIGLIFRGVAFEFREHSHNKTLWNHSFAAGSLLAALAQGLAMGGWIQGIEADAKGFTGGVWDWATPYSLFLATAVVMGYVLLGTTFLVHKTTGEMQARARRQALVSLAILAVQSMVIMIWTPQVQNRSVLDYVAGWQAVFPVLGLWFFWRLTRSLLHGHEHKPFLYTAAVFAVSLAGLTASMAPWILPGVSVVEAAASPFSLLVMTLGVGALVPVLVLYNVTQYWTFRGKVSEGHSYHHE